MCKTFRNNLLFLMWFVLNSVLETNAFETYSETDQLAEESIGGYDKEGHQETTTNANLIYSNKESKSPREGQSDQSTSIEDDPTDPLQKILPKVKFNCKGKSEGYYADSDFCEVFHYCKTTGFRFTFMCPPESYYNEKLMACELNSTLSKCVDREKHNKTLINISNATEETFIKPNVTEIGEVLQKSSSSINTEKSQVVVTTTEVAVESTKVADPYLTRRRTHYGSSRSKPILISEQRKENLTQISSQEIRSQNQTKRLNVTQTILPFTGFRKFNRNKNPTKISNITKIINNSTKALTNSNEYTPRIPSNALPVLKSIGPQFLSNSNQMKNYRNKSRSKATTTTTTTTTSTTTTPHPSLLGPTLRDSTTVSPFDYFTPIFNSDPNFPFRSDFFPLSLHKRPENELNIKSNKRKPLMTQNFFNSILHTTKPPNFQKESQIEETLKQSETISESNSQLSPYSPSEESMHIPRSKSNESPLQSFNKQENQFNYESHLSDSQIQELVEKLKQMDNQQLFGSDFGKPDNSEAETSIEPNREKEDMFKMPHIESRKRREKNKSKQFVTVPLLVPTGVSKNDLRRKLSSSLLKPTVLPLTEEGNQMPAYVLQFQNSDRSKKSKYNKHRSRRQTFSWNPFQSNPFVRNSYYMPMNSMSSPVYSYFNNQMRPSLPMQTLRSRHLEIGEKPSFARFPSAQQHIPYYIPPKQPFIPNNFIGNNFYKDNNVYDLSEFSDFYENPLNNRPAPIMANDMSPYRPVSLRRPGFKRPPRREKIPDFNYNKTLSNDTKTTVRPSNSVPVSPRPYSQPIVKQEFYARNSNPFSDFSDQSINEAIRAFDNNEDNLQPLDPDFDSQSIFPYTSSQSFSNDFIPIIPRTNSLSDTLNGRSSRISKFSEIPLNNYVSDNFPPIPTFGDPEYRLPFVDIPDPTLNNLGHRSNSERDSNKESVQRKYDNSSRYSTPYSPEILNTNSENSNETERNPNHNYDDGAKEVLQTARTVDTKHNFGPLQTQQAPFLNWDNIVGQYHKQNISIINKLKVDKNDSNEQKESEISKNQRYVSYGTRLSGNSNRYSQNPEISVKTSISSVSSLQPEASDQIVISRKLGTSALSSQSPNDNKEKSIDELYNQRAFDRLMLFNYYNHLNSQKYKTSTSTTTVNPLDGKYPSTSHWSIRGWTGQYYPHSSKTLTTTTPLPKLTTNSHIEYLDLFESEAKMSETTTTLPETTTIDNPKPPYKKVFNSQMGATFHSNKYSKPNSFSHKTRSDITNYLSSLTSSLQTI